MKKGFPLHPLRFLIGVYGGPRLLLVENVATKVVRSGGSAVVAGYVHEITPKKLALVDSVDHTLNKLHSLFAAVLQRVIRLFTEHAERSRPSWSPGGFAPTCETTQCTRMPSARARGTWRSTTPAPGSVRAPKLWRCEQRDSGSR